MDFFTHWMITLAGAAFLGLCAVGIEVIQWMHGRQQKSHSDRTVQS